MRRHADRAPNAHSFGVLGIHTFAIQTHLHTRNSIAI